MLISKATVDDTDKPLGKLRKLNKNEYTHDNYGYWYDGPFRDPTNSVVGVCLYIYQCQSHVYQNLNKASRFNDKEKLPTLGPYAAALY